MFDADKTLEQLDATSRQRRSSFFESYFIGYALGGVLKAYLRRRRAPGRQQYLGTDGPTSSNDHQEESCR